MKFFKPLMIFYDSWDVWHCPTLNSFHLVVYCPMFSPSQFSPFPVALACDHQSVWPSLVFRSQGTIWHGSLWQPSKSDEPTGHSKGEVTSAEITTLLLLWPWAATSDTAIKALQVSPGQGRRRRGWLTGRPRHPHFLTCERPQQGLKRTPDASCEMTLSGIYRGKISSQKENVPFNHGNWVSAARRSKSLSTTNTNSERSVTTSSPYTDEKHKFDSTKNYCILFPSGSQTAPLHLTNSLRSSRQHRHVSITLWSPCWDSQQVHPWQRWSPHPLRIEVESTIPIKNRLWQVSSVTSLRF